MSTSHAGSSEGSVRVLLYSSNAAVREAVRMAVGRRPAPDLPPIRWEECATSAAVIAKADAGGLDLMIFDGEANPVGGMGLCKQLKDEIYECPPILVLTGRPQDAWLATWSRADHVVSQPIDPLVLAGAVAQMSRELLATADSSSSL